MRSILEYSENVKRAGQILAYADFVLIGAGAGLSAAAGLNYQDAHIFEELYPHFRKLGFQTIWEAISALWSPNDNNRRRFWAFWAHHIQKIRYDALPGQPYLDLRHLIDGKPHFVITTNVDGQFVKAGFDSDRIFTPQGDYGMFQCSIPCRNVLYENRDIVQQMIIHTNEENLLIREEDIPYCPNCGNFLERNLRIDEKFVQEPYMDKQVDYVNFINSSAGRKLLILELGVGFNTPGIIRWPFEQIVSRHPNATLIRMNIKNTEVPEEIKRKSIPLHGDIAQIIHDLRS